MDIVDRAVLAMAGTAVSAEPVTEPQIGGGNCASKASNGAAIGSANDTTPCDSAKADVITATLRDLRALVGELRVPLALLAASYGEEFDQLARAEFEASQGRRSALPEHLTKRLLAFRLGHAALRRASVKLAGVQ